MMQQNDEGRKHQIEGCELYKPGGNWRKIADKPSNIHGNE